MKSEFFEFMFDLVLDWENIPVYLPEDVEQDVDIIDVIDDAIDRIDSITTTNFELSPSQSLYKEGWDLVMDYMTHPLTTGREPIFHPGFRPIFV